MGQDTGFCQWGEGRDGGQEKNRIGGSGVEGGAGGAQATGSSFLGAISFFRFAAIGEHARGVLAGGGGPRQNQRAAGGGGHSGGGGTGEKPSGKNY